MRSVSFHTPLKIFAVAAASIAAGVAVADRGYAAFLAGALAVGLAIAFTWPQADRGHPHAGVRNALLGSALLLYLVPMLMFGRAFALIGASPVYLPDVLLILIVLLVLPRMRLAAIAPFPLLCVLIALFALYSVYVGYQHGYQAADKGLVLALYPLIAIALGGWIAALARPDRVISVLPRYVLPLVTVGLAAVILVNVPYIAASYGLYLGIAAAFAATPGTPNRRLLGLSTAVGLAILVGTTAERGPTLTVLLAAMSAWLIGTRFRSSLAAIGRVLMVAAAVVAVALIFSLGFGPGGDVPVVGRLATRVAPGNSAEGLSAANNVSLRTTIWSYALRTTYRENPIFGLGAYHPIEITYLGNNLRRNADTGVHNSFVGYIFYAGYLAGILVLAVFILGFYRTWQARHRSIYAPALFGSLVAVVATALTNVALETTYIGGPSWAVLAVAVGLGATRSRVADSSRSLSGATRDRDLLDPVT